MEPTAKNKWWQGSWTIPVSLMLHVLVGATYLLSSNFTPAPAEPETVSVEMVEPPKEDPPPKPEEKKSEEPPPPPAPEKTAEPPPPPPPPQMPSVAVRPGPTQLDERDEPGQQDAGGQEQEAPAKQEEAAEPPATPPSQTPDEAQDAEAAAEKPTAEQGEIAAAEAPTPPDVESVAVPIPKPEPAPEPAKALPVGEEGPNLKPAKKILVGAKRPGAMLRQIMGNLSPRDRVAQLCVAEAMAQIKQERNGQYDGLEPHTGKNYPITGNLMNAQGAFNVGTQWFPIDYRCEVDIDNYLVTDFRYAIGSKLTPDDVKRLKLIVR